MPDEEALRPPLPGKGDTVYAVVKSVVSAIPVLGGVAAEILGRCIASPLSRRQQIWMESVAQELVELQAPRPGFLLEDLQDNERFVSATLQATQAALKTHSEEKRRALRNALLNVVLSTSGDESEQEMFLYLVDRLTPFHLQVFGFVAGTHSGKLEEFPHLTNWELAHQAATELESLGLIAGRVQEPRIVRHQLGPSQETERARRLRALQPGEEVRDLKIEQRPKEYIWQTHGGDVGVSASVTELGSRFLAFISAPEDKPGMGSPV